MYIQMSYWMVNVFTSELFVRQRYRAAFSVSPTTFSNSKHRHLHWSNKAALCWIQVNLSCCSIYIISLSMLYLPDVDSAKNSRCCVVWHGSRSHWANGSNKNTSCFADCHTSNSQCWPKKGIYNGHAIGTTFPYNFPHVYLLPIDVLCLIQ